MSLSRLEEHRRLWARKPVLARIYAPWFEFLLESAARGGRVVEVGAGPGAFGAVARAARPDLVWIATDLLPCPWNDLAADAARLPFRSGSVDAVVGLDVLHHLPEPAAFLAEAARVLAPAGRLALVEPWITPLAWVVYRFFHQEDCRLGVDPWHPFAGAPKGAFDGDAALPWRIVCEARLDDWERFGLTAPRVTKLNAFAYMLSLGFRPSSLLPSWLVRPAQRLDALSSVLAPLAALRAVLVWERGPEPPATPEGQTARPSASTA